MRVYIESNFIIELARLQNQHDSCASILKLAEGNRIDLILPAFGVEEPYGAWGRKSGARKALVKNLINEAAYLTQSKIYYDVKRKFDDVRTLLKYASAEEKKSLNETMSRVLKATTVIPVDQVILDNAPIYQDEPFDLSPQDSIIYSAVLSDLAKVSPDEPRCFLNKNRKDFNEPAIIGKLKERGCKLITNFANGLGYINSQI